MSKFSSFMEFSKKVMSCGLLGTVESVISSTGSIRPCPITFFQRRLAITKVKRGLSLELIQAA
jgi:hypothetical protein